MSTRVSLAELAAARIQLRPAEAIAIVDEICRRCEDGVIRGIPPAGVVRLSRAGHLSIEGPTDTGDEVARASQLLNDLLPAFDATPEYRASGALRLAIARGLGTLDLPAYESYLAGDMVDNELTDAVLAESLAGIPSTAS